MGSEEQQGLHVRRAAIPWRVGDCVPDGVPAFIDRLIAMDVLRAEYWIEQDRKYWKGRNYLELVPPVGLMEWLISNVERTTSKRDREKDVALTLAMDGFIASQQTQDRSV